MTSPDPRMRAADVDRQAVVDRLTDHFTAGRLTASEYDERVRQAYASTYLDELPTLLADLPEENRSPSGGFPGWGRDDESARSSAGGRSAGWGGDGRSWPGASGWAGRSGEYRGGPPWAGRGQGYRRRPIALLPVIIAVALLIALTHGAILIPLFWVGLAFLVFGRHRRGGCGRRIGPHSAP